MRIIAPFILALLGAGIGLGINWLFTRSSLKAIFAVGIGVAGAFFGLILRDALDYKFTSDPLMNALLAAILMAIIASVFANICMSFRKPE